MINNFWILLFVWTFNSFKVLPLILISTRSLNSRKIVQGIPTHRFELFHGTTMKFMKLNFKALQSQVSLVAWTLIWSLVSINSSELFMALWKCKVLSLFIYLQFLKDSFFSKSLDWTVINNWGEFIKLEFQANENILRNK